MLKRITACILLLVMLQVPAVLGAGTEGVTNGDFSVETGETGWSTSDTAIIENGALRLTGSANTGSSQRVINIIGGNTYTFKTKYKFTGNSPAYLSVYYFTPRGWTAGELAFNGDEYSKYLPASKEWAEWTDEITVPKYVTAVDITLRRIHRAATVVNGVETVPTGDVYWDDVSLTGTFGETPLEENPFKADAAGTAELSLDEVFYYTDKTTATATVKEDLAADKVEYTLYEGKTKQWVKKENYGKPFTFALSSPQSSLKEETQYRLSARVKNGSSVIAEGEQIFYRVKRPTALDADGKYYPVTVDKNTGEVTARETKAFEPVFMYHTPEGYFGQMKERGVNVVQGQASVLDAAAKAGIKVLVVLYSASPQPTGTSMLPAGHPNNSLYTRYIVNKYKHHEAVYGWLIMDEPYYNLSTREAGPRFDEKEVLPWLLNSYRVIHEEDPHHPVFVMQDHDAYYGAVSKAVDILGIDPYLPDNAAEQKQEIYQSVYKRVKGAVAATGGEKPVYALLQAYRFFANKILPTEDQLRHMVYEARLAGAHGFGYYSFDEADYECYNGDYSNPKKDANGNRILISMPNTHIWDALLEIKNESERIFALETGEPRAQGVYEETEAGEGVLVYMGHPDVDPLILTATYSDSTNRELIDISFEPFSVADARDGKENDKMAVYEDTTNKKRFIWTDGQGFLAPGV